jgi:hypothetical protein
MLGIKNLNKTIKREARVDVVTVDEFRKLHENTPTTKIDGVVRAIVDVQKLVNGYFVTFSTGDTVQVTYDGAFGKNGEIPYERFDAQTGRSRVKVLRYNSSLYAEKLIGICDAWLNNELPSTFRGLVVNVMDGTANLYTANKLGLKPNFHEDNLEWTTQGRNTWHGKHILKIASKTKCVYKYSANDQALIDAWDTKGKLWLCHYMMNNYRKVNSFS